MPANQFERHRKARGRLKELFAQPAKVSAIHYSCESFYDLSWQSAVYLAKKHPLYTAMTVIGGGAGAITAIVKLIQQL